MQIKILEKIFECENQVLALEKVFDQINQMLDDLNRKVSCLEIDGVEVYEDYDQYIVTNLAEIKTIIVRVKTPKELMDDTLICIQDYLVRAVPEIEQIVDEFYHGVHQHTWHKFAQLLDGLQFIIDTLNVVSEHQDWYGNAALFVSVKQDLLKQIAMLQEAMEGQDRVWISDVLLYEIVPSFEALIKRVVVDTNSGQIH